MKPWTEAELIALKQSYPAESIDTLVALFNRPVRAIRNKAYLLGITKTPDRNKNHPKVHRWTEAEDAIVRRWWPDVSARVKGRNSAWLAQKLGLSQAQVRQRASILGLRRLRIKEPVWSDQELELLDQWLHLPPHLIRARLNRRGFHRTEAAICVQRTRRFGGIAMATGGYSATQVARLLGVTPKPVLGWIKQGLLSATPRGISQNESEGPGDRWTITPSALRVFIIDNPIYVTNQVNLIWLIELISRKRV